MPTKSSSSAASQASAQLDKFREAARAAECNEDEARWDEALKRVVKHKPAPEKPD